MDYRDMTDDVLMKYIASGDRVAFRKLYQNYCPLLIAISLRIVKRREVAEEIIHDVFVQVWLTADSFNSNLSSAKTWLSHLVRNKSIDWLRARDNQWQVQDDTVADQPELSGAPDRLAEDNESERRLLRCMENLPNNQQQSIVLAWFQGLSHADIAHYMNHPAGTVKSWIRRGLEHLKECVGL